MNSIISNPMFLAIILVLGSIGIWWVVTFPSSNSKKKILSEFFDSTFYYIVTVFTINALLNLSEVIRVPYSLLLFSADSVALSSIALLAYGWIKYRKSFERKRNELRSFFQLIALLGIVNHTAVYYQFSSSISVNLILLFVFLFFITQFPNVFKIIHPLLISGLISAVHFLFMSGQSVLYFNLVFRANTIGWMALLFFGTYLIERSGLLSE